MSDHAMSGRDIADAIGIMKRYGLEDPQSVTDVLLRVVKTRSAIAQAEPDAETVYRAMRKATDAMARFPGDADLFYTLYNALSRIDGRGILLCLRQANQGREPAAPDVLVEKFAEHITESARTVLIPECEQYGTGLLDLIEAHPRVSFTLTCRAEEKADLLSEVYGRFDNVKMRVADIYSFGFTAEKYDLIAAIPLFGGRMLVKDGDFISREPDLIAVQNLLYHISLDGELVIVLPAKITFGGGSTASLRDYIEQNYQIREISALPTGLFYPYAAVRTYLFVFSNGVTDDVVLKQYVSEKPIRKTAPCESLLVKNELLLFSDEFAAINGWNVDMAFSEADDDIRAFRASPVKKLPLKEVASVFRGKAIVSKSGGGNIGVINISDMTDTGIDYEGADFIEEEERKVSRYILADGDVLVTSRGTTVKAAVFEAQPAIYIPSANINVIRPGKQLKGAYLKLFLESPVGVKMIRSLQRGTGVVNINFQDMSELEVPVPPLDEQEAIVREYNIGLRFYKDTISAAEEGWRSLRQEIQSKLY